MQDININEEAKYTKSNKYPVFIVLTYGDNPLGLAISKITGDKWSHVLISFNPQLNPMYTLGTRTHERKHESLFGFTYQSTKDKWYKTKYTKYAVYVMYVNKKAYDKMQERLEYFKNNEKDSEYDFPGIIAIGLNHDTEHHRKYFCSRFVAEILSQGIGMDKLPSLYRPQELSELNDISLVNAGPDLYDYDPKVTVDNINRIKRKIYNKFVYQEDNMNDANNVKNIIMEKYLEDKLSYDKYLELMEAVLDVVKTTTKLFGCPVTYKASKIDKKASKVEGDPNSVIDEAARLINTNPKIQAAIQENVLGNLLSPLGMTEGDIKEPWTNFFKVVRVEATMVGNGVPHFKCELSPKPTINKLIKQQAKNHVDHAKKFKSWILNIQAPLDVKSINDDYLNSFMSMTVMTDKWKEYKKK
jgi:hypothetical protein